MQKLNKLLYAILNPYSIVYFFIGHYKAFIHKKYTCYFKDDDKLEEMFRIVESCPHQCIKNGTRVCCGCDSFSSTISLKPCDLNKKKKITNIVIRETKQF